MFTLTQQSNNVMPYVSEFVVDTKEEIEEINVYGLSAGSTCIVLEDSSVYMLNNKNKWVLL